MKIKNNAFSLIEVIIATSIISITVFGVYKLIGENTKIISNAGSYQQVNILFPVLNECLESLNNDFGIITIGSGFNIYLGNTLTGCIKSNTSNLIDNIEYSLYGEITATGENFIERTTYITSDQINTKTGYYKQIK